MSIDLSSEIINFTISDTEYSRTFDQKFKAGELENAAYVEGHPGFFRHDTSYDRRWLVGN
jgi:hypothetical protein